MHNYSTTVPTSFAWYHRLMALAAIPAILGKLYTIGSVVKQNACKPSSLWLPQADSLFHRTSKRCCVPSSKQGLAETKMVQSCTNGPLKNGKMYSIIHKKPGEPDDSEALRVQVFMLSADGELDSPTLQAILDSGHSRIPIHRGADRWDCCSARLKNPVGTIGAFAASAPSCSQAAA